MENCSSSLSWRPTFGSMFFDAAQCDDGGEEVGEVGEQVKMRSTQTEFSLSLSFSFRCALAYIGPTLRRSSGPQVTPKRVLCGRGLDRLMATEVKLVSLQHVSVQRSRLNECATCFVSLSQSLFV